MPELKSHLQKNKLVGVNTTYVIGENDKFSAVHYPDVAGEMEALRESLVPFDTAYKTEIVISMLKDHSIKTEWIADNKMLVKLFTSGSLKVSHIESLFYSCRHNRKFTAGLEKHIAEHFLPSGVYADRKY